MLTQTGTIDAANVIGQAGKTYVNVHTDQHRGGEIRGQVREDRSR